MANSVVGRDGCDVDSKCLECPLSSCLYDGVLPRQRVPYGSQPRAVELRDMGRSALEIAATLGISRRSVDRLLRGSN